MYQDPPKLLSHLMKKSNFTLLEIMVAIALFAIASGVIGWKMHQAVANKRFQSELEQLQQRLTVAQKLAVAMQADWKGTLKKEKKGWVFEIVCEERTAKHLPPLRLHGMEIFLDQKKIGDAVIFDFFASGKVLPAGDLSFRTPSNQMQWKVSEIFQRKEGEKLGPSHPEPT